MSPERYLQICNEFTYSWDYGDEHGHLYFPENIKLFVAKYKEQMIAGTLLFVYPNVVHTQYMAANEVAREIGGLDLLSLFFS